MRMFIPQRSYQLCYCVADHPAEGSLSAGIFNKMLQNINAEKRERMSVDTFKLEEFLKQAEKRAFRMAQLATSDNEEALDIVQDAMMLLATRYANRDTSEWPPLFYRIVQNRIKDWYRKQKVRSIFTSMFSTQDGESDEDPIQMVEDTAVHDPVRKISAELEMQKLEEALRNLPLRQQQTFLLRNWEGYDVNQTAEIMGVSPGSVKTHYSRALQSLKDQLQ